MSVLIKGMEMPKNCRECRFINCDFDWFHCIAGRKGGHTLNLENKNDELIYTDSRHPNCPLVEVPTPHGRLIDCERKTFPTEFKYNTTDYAQGWNACIKAIHTAPTIIEAEENE